MNTGGIRRISIGYERNFLIWPCGANGFIHSADSRLSASVIGDVISGNFQAFRRDKEEDVVMNAHDLYISFIAGAYGVDRPFKFQVKEVAVKSSGRGVIEDGLIRDLDVKDRSEDISGFSSGDSEGYVEGEDKA